MAYKVYGRNESNAVKREAAEIIRNALPYNLTGLFDALLISNELGPKVEMGQQYANDYFWYNEDSLKKAVENAKSTPPMNKPEELLTVGEAAKFTKASPSTIYRLIRSGDLSVIRFGRLVRVERKDLENLLKRSKIGDL